LTPVAPHEEPSAIAKGKDVEHDFESSGAYASGLIMPEEYEAIRQAILREG
jgi:hypothetical protein